MRRLISLCLVAVAFVTTACMSYGPSTPRSVARPEGIEGTWIDAQGVAVSTLTGGVFVSVANDTGQRLSEGTYTYRDPRTIDLTINSIIRGTTTQATCIQAGIDQLNCTNSDGVRFVLLRRQAVG